MHTAEKYSVSIDAECAFDGLEAIAQVGVLFELVFDASGRVQNGGVVAVIEESAKLWIRHFGELTAEVHREFSGDNDAFGTSSSDDLFGFELVVFHGQIGRASCRDSG